MTTIRRRIRKVTNINRVTELGVLNRAPENRRHSPKVTVPEGHNSKVLRKEEICTGTEYDVHYPSYLPKGPKGTGEFGGWGQAGRGREDGLGMEKDGLVDGFPH